MLREALLHRTLLVFRLQPCNFKRMRVVELASAERLLCFVDEFQQLQSSVHIGGRLSNFGSYGFDRIAWLQAQQVSVALPLVKLVGIRTLNVLDQLQFEHSASVKSRTVAGIVSRLASFDAR